MTSFSRLFLLLAFATGAVAGVPARAQDRSPPLQPAAEAWAQDAREYASRYAVPLDEALRRLRAQEESVAATDALQEEFSDRFAGLSIEHQPYRITVRLTGEGPVEERVIRAGGMDVPVVFRTGARASRDDVLRALVEKRREIADALPQANGMGFDPRTGELVLMMRRPGAESFETAADLQERIGVPIRVRALEEYDVNTAVEGGARVVGTDPANGRRYVCTTGFVVTDGERAAILTAAHCPDDVSYIDPVSGAVPLHFLGGWGARYQDVQIHGGDAIEAKPTFHADTAKKVVRELTGWRNRTSTRAGDVVCRRGETSGYSCSEVELVDYAPPGELCGGPCDPTWVTVAGPSCRGGDSGGPVFLGTLAFGVIKGANYGPTGKCSFYYYMSTDFLPPGWSLLHPDSAVFRKAAAKRMVAAQTATE